MVRNTDHGHYFPENYRGPSLEEWQFLVTHLQTPNLTAHECLETLATYMSVAVKHESTWKTRMMREDYFPVARLYYVGFLLIHPHFEVPAFWQMGMHILHMLSTLSYRPAILTLYRYFAQIRRRRDPKSETYRYIQGKYQELINSNDANACTWKAVEVWDPKKPLEAIMYLDKAMKGYKGNPDRYLVEPLVLGDEEMRRRREELPAITEKIPGLVKPWILLGEMKEKLLEMVVSKETGSYALRRQEMLDRILQLDKKPARLPLWTWEGMYRVRRGMAYAMLGQFKLAAEELRIAADELDIQEGHSALAGLMSFEADKIGEWIKSGGEDQLELSSAFADLYTDSSVEGMTEAMRLLNEEAELRFKRAAQGGDIKALEKLESLCLKRMEEPGLSKREKDAYKLAAREWGELSRLAIERDVHREGKKEEEEEEGDTEIKGSRPGFY